MISYQNPFRYRASEQQRDLRAFLRSFGPAALHMLPEAVWDRLVVLRSAPGAGKTSLMRVFTAESTRAVIDDSDAFRDLAEALASTGAIEESSPAVLGAYINLERDYRSLIDISANDTIAQRLFFRLLDVRVMLAFIRAVLVLSKRTYPEDVGRIVVRPRSSDAAVEQAARRLGGLDGAAIYTACAAAEKKMLEMLDSLLPVEWEHEDGGHNDLYSLRLLSASELLVDGEILDVRPLIMFDDGHRLHSTQRSALLERLADRGLDVARWYAERYEALSRQDLLDQVGKEGRDLAIIRGEIEHPLADPSLIAVSVTERAFKHLQWLIASDSEVGAKWRSAFARGEATCERFGATHLLLHDIQLDQRPRPSSTDDRGVHLGRHERSI